MFFICARKDTGYECVDVGGWGGGGGGGGGGVIVSFTQWYELYCYHICNI